jgi:hypothetical protein
MSAIYRLVRRRRPELHVNPSFRIIVIGLCQYHEHKPGLPVGSDREPGEHAPLHIEFVVYRFGRFREERPRNFHTQNLPR